MARGLGGIAAGRGRRAEHLTLIAGDLSDREIAACQVEQSGARRLGDVLGSAMARLSNRSFDPGLSSRLAAALVEAYAAPDAVICQTRLRPFLRRNDDALKTLYRRYADDRRVTSLLYQPGVLLIFELLERDPDRLRLVWPAELPLDELDALASIWGVASQVER